MASADQWSDPYLPQDVTTFSDHKPEVLIGSLSLGTAEGLAEKALGTPASSGT